MHQSAFAATAACYQYPHVPALEHGPALNFTHLCRLALAGEGGSGGLDDGLRTVEGHLSAILGVEEAHAALAGEGGEGASDPHPLPDPADPADDGAAAAVEAALDDVARARAALADAGAKVRRCTGLGLRFSGRLGVT